MASLRVLIVEDDAFVLDTLVDMTRLLGHQPHGCARATIAQDLLREHSYDLLIVDSQMPGMTGLELINSIENKHAMKVAMISGYLPPAELAAEINWLQKPFDVAEYEALLAETVAHVEATASTLSKDEQAHQSKASS